MGRGRNIRTATHQQETQKMQTNLARQISLAADKVNRWTHKRDHAEVMLEKWQKRRNHHLTTQQADKPQANKLIPKLMILSESRALLPKV
jgi:IS5 family transposase